MSTLAPSVVTRQAIEKRVVVAAIDQLLAAGYRLGVNDGEETTLRQSTDKTAILAALFTTDEDTLLVWDEESVDGEFVWNGGKDGPKAKRTEHDWWVRLVYGNDGWDVISDYCIALEDNLTDATSLANRIGDGDFTVTIG